MIHQDIRKASVGNFKAEAGSSRLYPQSEWKASPSRDFLAPRQDHSTGHEYGI